MISYSFRKIQKIKPFYSIAVFAMDLSLLDRIIAKRVVDAFSKWITTVPGLIPA